jgi:hypothetical protein
MLINLIHFSKLIELIIKYRRTLNDLFYAILLSKMIIIISYNY